MKVIAINGSPRADGNCYRALERLGSGLEGEGVGFEIHQVGGKALRGCIACESCRKTGKCVFADDPVNELVERMAEADGIVLASPVYYSGVAGAMKCFADRAFYSSGGRFRHKVGATLVSVRRSGGSSTLDCLNHYLTISEMIVATSSYWSIVHGGARGEVERDAEALDTIDALAANMAWILRMREATRESVPEPPPLPKAFTNFIR